MTKEEAKEVFINRGYVTVKGGTIFDGDKWRQSVKVITEWLKEQPCTDAISRQAVIDAIYACYIGGKEAVDKTPVNDLYAEGIYEAVCAVEDLPSVSVAEKTGRWIPVSERLPENSGRYLAYIVNKHDDKLQYIMTCDYSVDGYWNWFPDDECASDNVIAWMPLPEPYKAESEGEE